MKSDISIFSIYYFGIIIAIIGNIIGLFILFGNTGLGLVFMIGSIIIGKYLMFKAKRRKRYILYDGGNI